MKREYFMAISACEGRTLAEKIKCLYAETLDDKKAIARMKEYQSRDKDFLLVPVSRLACTLACFQTNGYIVPASALYPYTQEGFALDKSGILWEKK